MGQSHSLTAAELRRILSYDKETGEFHWLVSLSNRALVGARAGSVCKNGYRYIGIGGRLHLEHRLAWLHVTGDWPRIGLDHRDRNPLNNRWENLREATRSQNQCNRPCGYGVFGMKGVSRERKGFKAEIKHQGVRRYLGNYPTPEQAHNAYVEAAKDLHGEFACAG